MIAAPKGRGRSVWRDSAVNAASAVMRFMSSSSSDWRLPVGWCAEVEAAPMLELSMTIGDVAPQNFTFASYPFLPRGNTAYNLDMTTREWTIRRLREALAKGAVRPSELAQQALARANGNAGHNTYLWRDSGWTMAEAARTEAIPCGRGGVFDDGRDALWGLPVSVKD